MNKILLIDDNMEIQAANRDYLTSKGYQVEMAMDGATAIALLKTKKYDCVVLDVMLPDLDGFTVCSVVRKNNEKTPIIFLSCLDENDYRVKGLMIGGDDYMTKPYSLKELAARIYSLVRRNKIYAGMDSGVESPNPGVMVQRENSVIAIRGFNLFMSRTEYEILSLFVARPRELITKSELLALVAGEEATLFTCIKRIRSKLAADESLGEIKNKYGEGYIYMPAKESGIGR
ncbi:MAG: response regulator transcription factor [Firmicutes bacterium]|nr:response regulator transcription factor [Bacillota bacterium]